MTLRRPLLSLILFCVWLLAWGSWHPGLVALGAGLALLLTRLTEPFWPRYPGVVNRRALLELLAVFAVDIVVANLMVAKRILGPNARLNPQFVEVPVDMEQPLVTALLANMISLTPGTVSSNLSGDGRTLLVHALDVDDANGLVREIKHRYERRLKEVFAC